MSNCFSSHRQPLDHTFLSDRLKNAISHKRIAGYFSSLDYPSQEFIRQTLKKLS